MPHKSKTLLHCGLVKGTAVLPVCLAAMLREEQQAYLGELATL